MKIFKYIILIFLFLLSSILGKMLSKKYVERLEELEDFKNCLNIFKAKIKFTYSPINEIFQEISFNCNKKNISNIFIEAQKNMKNYTASLSWDKSLNYSKNKNNLNQEDIKKIKMLAKELGTLDVEGQINQIQIVEQLIETQIKYARQDKEKNEKLYKKLGTTLGLMIVIILI